MSESADYILANIIALQKDIDMSELYQDVAMYALILGLVLCAVSFVILCKVSNTPDWLMWVFIVSGFFALCGGIGLVAVSFDLHFMHGQMEDLKLAYESVYGPLPEGILW